jgi:hypothetical protein
MEVPVQIRRDTSQIWNNTTNKPREIDVGKKK